MFCHFIFSLIFLLPSVLSVNNLDVSRKIDVKRNVVRIEHQIVADQLDSFYEFAVHPVEAKYLSFISATTINGDDISFSEAKEKSNVYSLDLRKHSERPIRFNVLTVFTGILEPKPAGIIQGSSQFIKYSGNVMYYSPYKTSSQLTEISLPSSNVIAFTSVPEPVNLQSRLLTYGKYTDQNENSYVLLDIHFENNSPLLTVTQQTRLVEVSHWGNIAFEETLQIENKGAKLEGSFSRLDFDLGIGRQSAVVSFKTALPASAKNIYYRDEIGNISTSKVMELLDATEIQLSPRFPILGGWKTQYTLGYNVPAYEFLYRSGSQFALHVRFVDHVYDDQVVENITLKVVLPELVSDVKVELPYPVYEESTEVLKTYLDTVGRHVLVFKTGNLITEHIKDIIVHYRFNMLLMLREPLMLVSAFCLVFICVMIYVRLDFSIFQDEQSELRMRVQVLAEEAQDIYKRRSTLYQYFEDALQSYISGKDSSNFQKERRELDVNHKQLNKALNDIQAQFSDLYGDGVEKLSELMNLDQRYRDLYQEHVQLAERLIGGSLVKARYQTSTNEIINKKADLVHRMQVIVESL